MGSPTLPGEQQLLQMLLMDRNGNRRHLRGYKDLELSGATAPQDTDQDATARVTELDMGAITLTAIAPVDMEGETLNELRFWRSRIVGRGNEGHP